MLSGRDIGIGELGGDCEKEHRVSRFQSLQLRFCNRSAFSTRGETLANAGGGQQSRVRAHGKRQKIAQNQTYWTTSNSGLWDPEDQGCVTVPLAQSRPVFWIRGASWTGSVIEAENGRGGKVERRRGICSRTQRSEHNDADGPGHAQSTKQQGPRTQSLARLAGTG